MVSPSKRANHEDDHRDGVPHKPRHHRRPPPEDLEIDPSGVSWRNHIGNQPSSHNYRAKLAESF